MSKKCALVTGATKNLGRAVALHLARRGYRIIAHYKSSKCGAQQLQSEIQALGGTCILVAADLADSEQIDHIIGVVQQEGGLDILVNNVGNYCVQSLQQTGREQMQELWLINTLAPLTLCQKLYSYLKQSRGNIINIGAAGLQGAPNFVAPAYYVTKKALLEVTKNLAREWGRDYIRVNMISPGQQQYSVDAPADKGSIPLQRLGTDEDILQAFDFLLLPDSYVTGANIEVTGGFLYSS